MEKDKKFLTCQELFFRKFLTSVCEKEKTILEHAQEPKYTLHFSTGFLTGIIIVLIIFLLPNSLAFTEEDFISESEQLIEEIKTDFYLEMEINLKISNIKQGSAEAHRFPFIGYEIVLDYYDLTDIKEDELKGLIAHELAHIKDYSNRNWFSMAGLGVKYLFSKDYRKNLERQTDFSAIEAGYGNELLAFRKYKLNNSDEEELKKVNELYLSVEEIEELLQD